MHNSFAMKNVSLTLIGLLLLANAVVYGRPTAPTPVEVWAGGDDGLTQRLRDAVETKFKASSDFVLSTGKKAGTLIVTIPDHVAWTKQDARTQIRYSIEFSSIDGTVVGRNKGSCWDDNLAECADQMYRGAQKAARTLSQ